MTLKIDFDIILSLGRFMKKSSSGTKGGKKVEKLTDWA
jgi:hypothetical protein